MEQEYKTPIRARYVLDREEVEKNDDGQIVIYHKGEKELIETSQVKWGEVIKGPQTFLTSGNKGAGNLKYEVFQKELEDLINKLSMEHFSNTPDFILAEYLVGCLKQYAHTHTKCNEWHSEDNGANCETPVPGG